jgi:hypothetical protein
MTEKLKPCPFCGGEARPSEQVVPNTDIRYWIAICANCAASTPLENWNTRPSVVPDREAVARIIREHVKVDATGLAPAVVGHCIFGFEDAADAILSLPASQEG